MIAIKITNFAISDLDPAGGERPFSPPAVNGKGDLQMDSMYPKCEMCGKGILLPVNMGREGDRSIIYRCTNAGCNVRFDEHGYEKYSDDTQEWVRVLGV